MKILFVNLSAVAFTVATPETTPLGGTESCIAYLSRQMSKNGHDVTLVALHPKDSPDYIMGVRHVMPNALKQLDFLTSNKFEVIVVCNAASLCPILKAMSPTSLLLLWDHVPPEQPSIKDLGQPAVLNSIDCIVYVSEWQKQETQRYFKFQKNSLTIGNGLTPSFENMFSSPLEILQEKENSAAYTTIPYRGLSILLKVMEELQEDTKLDLFSSMQVYQMADDEYRGLYNEAKKNPHIHSYGSVSQSALAHHLKKIAFLTYPCICAETFCIGALEALAAGMKVITTDLGALSSTTMGYADLIPITSNNPQDLIRGFQLALKQNIHTFLCSPEEWAEKRFDQIQSVNRTCTWSRRGQTWENGIHGLRPNIS